MRFQKESVSARGEKNVERRFRFTGKLKDTKSDSAFLPGVEYSGTLEKIGC